MKSIKKCLHRKNVQYYCLWQYEWNNKKAKVIKKYKICPKCNPEQEISFTAGGTFAVTQSPAPIVNYS